MSSLFVIKGRDQGRKFELSADPVRLGRDKDNEIIINDAEASRHHAEVRTRDNNQFELVDLDSSNGTYVNEHRVRSHLLQSGDRIRIGRSVLIFTAAPSSRNLNPADLVKIVQSPLPESPSRIVSSMVADGTESVRQLYAGSQLEGEQRQLARTSLDIVYQTALAVSQTLDIDRLLERLMGMIFQAVEPDRGCILLFDPESDQMMPRISRSRRDQGRDDQIEISRSIVDYVVENQEGVLTSDAVNDNRWDSQASIIDLGVSEAICVPMKGRYDTQGVIYVDRRTPPGQLAAEGVSAKLSTDHLKLMIAIGHQAALAVEDTNFYSAMIQSERMAAMGQTIATLSHHIKNILQGINGGSYLVKSGIAGNEMDVVESGWKIVEKNQQKISQLVMDMLSFSKDREPDLEPGNLNETVGDVVELMELRAAENGVNLQWHGNPDLPECLYDAEGIHRAVLNVISNAIDAFDHSEEPGQVTIETGIDQQRNRVEIHIRDNGPGIPPEFLPRIFGVFESGKGQKGTGLGLPVSRKIMTEHGGDIEVESTPGQGSHFCLHFPLQTSATNGQTVEIPER